MYQLKEGCTLQGGKYRIVKNLGTGGFGITYQAIQVSLGRNVAIKEFFMKDYCDRDGSTSHVSVPTENSRQIVESYKQKFIKEAQTIAALNDAHIVKIHDIFEENGTAYYVMEYLGNGSLRDLVKEKGPLSENDAIRFIMQIGQALSYVHKKKVLHLDIKPSNVLLNEYGEAVLIDFGISKHYDSEGGQTSTTPVGISKGYAPMEQYQQGSITNFSPATDIYSLGATLYFLLTGITPPDATEVNEDGLPKISNAVGKDTERAIRTAMMPRRKDRPQSIAAFLSMLEGRSDEPTGDELTVIINNKRTTSQEDKNKEEATILKDDKDFHIKRTPNKKRKEQKRENTQKKYLWLGLLMLVILIPLLLLMFKNIQNSGKITSEQEAPYFHINGMVDSELAISFEAEGGQTVLNFTKNFEEDWEYSETPDWVKIHKGISSFTVICEKNSTKKARSTCLNLRKKGLEITLSKLYVNQNARDSKLDKTAQAEVSVQSGNREIENKTMITGYENGHEWVDMGLSVKWATCNVGASSPNSYGNYYAWGETKSKSVYDWAHYYFCISGNSDSVIFSKYNTDIKYGSVDGLTMLLLSDDAARAVWHGNWRIPTKENFEELISQCTWKWIREKGVRGYKITSNKTGNSIFLPAASMRYGSVIDKANAAGYYWASSLSHPLIAWSLDFYPDSFNMYANNRHYGFSIRPVTD